MADKEHSSRVAIVAALFLLAGSAAVGLWLLAVPSTKEMAVARDGKAQAAMRRDRLTLITDSGEHILDIEVADGPEAQALGLMYRTKLPDDYGMLFPHPVAREAAMWMKNTYVPLDIVFINTDGSVHRIHLDAEPHSEALIRSHGPVAAVLELPAGAARRYGLKAGDKVRHPHFATP